MLIAYDTETDDVGDEVPRTCLIQIARLGYDLDDVVMFEGLDCFVRFFEWCEDDDERLDFHVFNLDYEFSRLWKEYLYTPECPYTWTEGRPTAGQWTTTQDRGGIYSFSMRLLNGKVLQMTDDGRRFPTKTMKAVATSIRKKHTDWWTTDEVKTEVGYNDGWFEDRGEKGRLFREYARLDAYSQSQIMRYTHDTGQDVTLTAASHGLKRALSIAYGVGDPNPSFPARKRQEERFLREYPPLPPDMQEIAEESLLGGYVWGSPGLHRGTFVHVDYSSSYPAEYHHGRMFKGSIVRCQDPEQFDRLLHNDRLLKWVRVSFRFRQRPGRIAVVSGSEIDWSDHPLETCPPGAYHNKVTEGRISKRLYTLTYFEELSQHVTIEDLTIHEIWYSKVYYGRFSGFIEKCYTEKALAKERGDDVDYDEWKRLMNSGIHGKTITKTHRDRPIYHEDGTRTWEPVVGNPRYCFMIGFTAMENARERLLRHCRILEDAGHPVLMCDTDSIVCRATEAEIREILGPEAFITEGGGVRNLGRFEVETDDRGRTEFPEFRCWGLKRYLEIDPDGQPRKAAFAGMRRDVQKTLLMTAPLDGSEFSWSQFSFTMDRYGKTGKDLIKRAALESVIWSGKVERKNRIDEAGHIDDWWKWFKENVDWSYDI